MEAIGPLLGALQQEDDSMRQSAEAAWFQMVKVDPVNAAAGMVSQLRTNADEGSRALAAVLIRQVLKKAWVKLTDDVKGSFKSSLLAALMGESVTAIRQKIVHAVAMVASLCAYAPSGGPASPGAVAPLRFVLAETWPELMAGFGTLVSSSDNGQRLLGLFMAQTLMGILGDPLAAAWSAPLRPLLATLLSSPPDAESAIAAARTAVTLVRVYATTLPDLDDAEAKSPAAAARTAAQDAEIGALQGELLSPVLSVVRTALGSAATEPGARHIIQDLMSMVRYRCTFVRPLLAPLVELILTAARTEALAEPTRCSALELAVMLCEFGGGMMRKHPEMVEAIVAATCGLLVTVDDDAAWGTTRSHPSTFSHESDEEDNMLLGVAAQSVDRLSSALGGAQMIPRMMGLIGPWFEDGDWRKRRAACLCVGLAAEGSKRTLSGMLDGLARGVAKRFADPHPRVRYAALSSSAQLVTDFMAPEAGHKSFQAQTHTWFIPSVLGCLAAEHAATGPAADSCGGAAACLDRVRQLALHVIQVFCHAEHCKKSHVQPADTIMLHFRACVTEGSTATKQDTFLAVAALSTVIKEDFAAYYDTFMPLAKATVGAAAAAGEGGAALRNTALECVGVMCAVVTPDRCRADAIAVMETIKSSINPEAFAGDTSNAFQATGLACAHISRALGPDFGPFLPVVLPQLLRVMQQDVSVRIEALDLDQKDSLNDSGLRPHLNPSTGTGMATSVVDVPGAGYQRVTVNSEALQQKTAACSIVFHILQSSQAPAVPFIDAVAAAAASCVHQDGSQSCRVLAVSLVPLIVHIATLDAANPARGTALLHSSLTLLLNALETESSDEVMTTITEAACELFKISARSDGRAVLPVPALTEVMELLTSALVSCIGRWRETAIAYHDDEDFDDRKAEMLSEALAVEKESAGNIIDAVGYAIRANGPGTLAVLGGSILPVVTPLLDERSDPELRSIAVCMYDELLEHAPGHVSPILPTIAPHLLEGMTSPHADLRQSCVFGGGLLACADVAEATPYLAGIVGGLREAIAAADSHTPEMIGATENAVAALLRIVQRRPAELGPDGVGAGVSAVLQSLPLQADAIEARFVHAWFVRAVGSCSAQIVGGRGERAAACLKLLANIAGAHLSSASEDEDEALMDGETAGLVEPAAAAVGAKFPAEAARAAGGMDESLRMLLSKEATPVLQAASAHVDAATRSSASAWVSGPWEG